MSFDSLEFLIFLPLVVLLHWITPSRWRFAVLLAASYVFYAWWDAALAMLILAVTGVSYLSGRKLSQTNSPVQRKLWLALTLLSCLGLLAYFKYFNLLGQTVTAVLGLFGERRTWDAWSIILPVGVSFYSFQAMSYVVDVYRKNLVAERHFGYYALYISFFPQLVAGPIERAGNLLPQLRAHRRLCGADLHAGCRLLISGFFRKLVVADLCAPLVNAVYNAPNPDGSAVFLGTLLFAAQIYCDFDGYSMIAAGAARLLGVRLMRNFDRPYAAKSIRDFWRRWHISLSQWFTDYVYIPLGGSRRGLARQILATFAVFALSGLWHGAQWSFVVWGLLHGCYMTLELLGHRAAAALHRRQGRSLACQIAAGGWLGRAATLVCVCFAWIFFRAGSLKRARFLVKALLSPWDLSTAASVFAAVCVQYGGAMVLISLILCALLVLLRLPAFTADGQEAQKTGDMTWVFLLLSIALAWIIRLHSGGGNAFIYFQF